MKKLLAFLLVTAMLLSMLAVTAFADIENVEDSYTKLPASGVEFKEDATDGKYVRVNFIQDTNDKGPYYVSDAMNDTTKRYIVIDTLWRIPEVDKNSRAMVLLQLESVINGDGTTGKWPDLLEMELRTGRIRLSAGKYNFEGLVSFNEWFNLTFVLDRDNATYSVYLNGTLLKYTSGEGDEAVVIKDFPIQNTTAGFTVEATKLVCPKVMRFLSAVAEIKDDDGNVIQAAQSQTKITKDVWQTTVDETTPYIDFKLLKYEMSTESHTHVFNDTYDNASGHADENKHYHWCTEEDCTVVDAGEDHTWNLEHATETEDKKCTVCGYVAEYKTAHVHQMTEHAGTDATCTQDGTLTYYECSECGQWFKDQAGTEKIDDHTNGIVIKALGHDPKEGVNAKEATVDEEGYTGDTICQRCNKVLKRGMRTEPLDPDDVTTESNAESGTNASETKAPETTENNSGDKGCKSGISAGLFCTIAILGTGITVLRKRK